jgi:hypothetical protein
MTIKDKQKVSSLLRRRLEVVDFPVKDIKVPEKRIRLEKANYKNSPKYKALRTSIATLGLRNPISIKPNCELVEGFYRLECVKNLGWETISTIIDDMTDKEARLLEYQENTLRVDFTDYEIYTFIAQLKREHEKEYPKSKRGKYDRYSNQIQNHKTIIPTIGNMNGKDIPSFADTYGPLLGLKKSMLYEKAQIGEAILSETFHPKTIKAIKKGNLSRKQILQKLRQIRNRIVIKDRLDNTLQQKPTKIKKKKEPLKEELPDEVDNSNTFKKVEKIIKMAEKDLVVQKIKDKVENGEISIEVASEQVDKIEDLNISLIKSKIDKLKRINSQIEKGLNQVAKKEGIFSDDRCGSCSLAHLYIATCFKCGNVAKCLNCESLVFQVICEKDIIERVDPLLFRDPNQAKCHNSPDIKKNDKV